LFDFENRQLGYVGNAIMRDNVCGRQAGQYKVNITVSNPLSSASQVLIVAIVNSLYRLTLSGSPVVGAVRSVRTFNIGMLDFGPNSCIKVDFGDGSPAEFYGPDRFVFFILF